MKKLLKSVSAILVFLFVLAGCSSNTTEDSGGQLSGSLEPQPLATPVTLKVSVASPNETYSAVRLANLLGEFEKENITIEFVTIPSTESMPALASGIIDVAAFGVTVPFFNAVAGGADIRMVMVGSESSAASGVYVRSDIADLGAAALEGKTLGLSLGWGQTSAVPLEEYLQSADLTIDDVEVATIPLEELAVSLDSGVIDLSILAPPASLLFEKNGNAKRVAGFENGERTAGYAFGKRLLTDEPEVGQAFIRAIIRTIDTYLVGDYKANAETRALLAEANAVTEDDLLLTESVSFSYFSQSDIDSGAFEIYTRAQDLWLRAGLLSYEELLEPSDYADWSFVQRILDNK
jgi:NitT/TauT family transport system substrate-binding protein